MYQTEHNAVWNDLLLHERTVWHNEVIQSKVN